MEQIIRGVLNFRSNVYPERKDLFGALADDGQNPDVLFITCSDSRIDPNLLTGSSPGDLFICRNAGNIIPPHSNETGGMTASIEYAVAVLGVKHIIVCGHTDCGAIQRGAGFKQAEGPAARNRVAQSPAVRPWRLCASVTTFRLISVCRISI